MDPSQPAEVPPGAIPPLNFLVGIWAETAFWGINTVIFALVCYVLFMRRNPASNRGILGTTSVLLYLCVTAHVSLSLRQLLEAFIYIPTDAPSNYADLYFAREGDRRALAKNTLYTTTVFIQDLVLIWRMYVVWGSRWTFAIPALVVELAHTACAYAAAGLLARPGADSRSSVLKALGSEVGWALELFVNIFATTAIASRLWWMGRQLARLRSNAVSSRRSSTLENVYMAPIFTVVESGAILIAVTTTLLILSHTGSPAVAACIDVAAQIAALVPYLIIVRVGLGLTHGLPNAYKEYMENRSAGISSNEITFRMASLGTSSRTAAETSGTCSDFKAADNSALDLHHV